MKTGKKPKNPLSKLQGKMREEKKSIRLLAPEINMSAPTLCLKLNGIYDFTGSEMASICNVLNIPAREIPLYFFPSMLRNET